MVVADLTYLVVDGENIDMTLGNTVLGRKPEPTERPRWDQIRAFTQRTWDAPVTGLFFLNASSGHLPTGFVQALLAMGYRPVPLSGPADVKVVDVGIQRTLAAIRNRAANVMLASHDGDFTPEVRELLDGTRQVGVLGFREYLSAGLANLEGITVWDIEHDARAFQQPLPRLRIIPLDEFDPELIL